MQSSYLTARDELFGQLSLALPAVATSLGYAPQVVYQGVEVPGARPTDKLWLRISQQTIIEEQDTLRTEYDGVLKRRYTTEGLVYIQVFIPKSQPQNYAYGLQAAVLIKNAYRGKDTPNCMWFKNVRIQELPPEEAWFRINVVSEYQYDELG